MSEHWIILLAYHFPPENTIGAARPYRFYKYLPRHGYRCHVITAADLSSRPDVQGESVPDPFLHNPGRGWDWQVQRFVRRFILPGVAGTQWAKHAASAARRFMYQHRGNRFTLFSTYPPLGPHMAAESLARRERLPWIADFRDPLGGNPAYAKLGATTHRTYNWLERRYMRRANRFIANTDAAGSALISRFPRDASRIHVIWNGFDPEERVQPLPIPSRSRRVLSHVGELYEGRTIAPFLHSIRRLISNGHLPPTSLQIQLTGPVQAACLPEAAFVQAAETEGWLQINPTQVPKPEAERLAQTSDNLLIVQPHSAIQVPGKLYEYLQIGRPILAVVPEHTPIERILSKSGVPYRCAYAGNSAEAFDRQVREFLEIPTDPTRASEWFENNFNAQAQTAALAQLIEDVQRR